MSSSNEVKRTIKVSSITPEDLSLLLKEELIARLMESDKRLQESAKREAAKDAQINELRTKYIIHTDALRENWITVEEMSKQLQRRVVIADDELSKDYMEQMHDLFNFSIEWMKDYLKQLKVGPFTKGKDVKQPKQYTKADEEKATNDLQSVEQATTKALRSMQQASKYLGKARNRITKAVSELEDIKRSEAGKAADSLIKDYGLQQDKETSQKQPSKGRVAKKRAVVSTKTAHIKEHTCNECGGNTEILETGKIVSEVLSGCDALKDLVSNCKNIHQVEICQNCGHVKIAVNDKQDLPVVPNRMIGLDPMFVACHYLHKGLPLNNLISEVREKLEIGHDTFSYNLHDFVRIYIKPIYLQILNAAKEEDVLVLDGTPFDCLETQGKRVSKNPMADADGKPYISSSNYILGITTPHHADTQLSVYGYLPKRNYESVAAIIDDSFKFTNLVTDAHPAYDELAKKHNAKLQNCLTHLRRYLLSGFDVTAYLKQLEPLPEKAWLDIIQKDISEENDKYFIYAAFTAINQIYANEKDIDYSLTGDKLREQILKVREKSKDVLSRASIIMSEMEKRHLVPSKSGKRLVKKKGDPFADATAYWYNNKDKFEIFISNPDVPVDSNVVEQAIRPITVLRKNINWKATVEYMEDLCMIYSVFETARKNNINDPVNEWLRPYARELWCYCVEKKYTQEIRDGMSLEKKIKSWDMQSLSEGFDFEKHNIFNFSKK